MYNVEKSIGESCNVHIEGGQIQNLMKQEFDLQARCFTEV